MATPPASVESYLTVHFGCFEQWLQFFGGERDIFNDGHTLVIPMDRIKKILVVVYDSDASMRAVTYVGKMIRGGTDVITYLLYVIEPLPPELREFGGSENPKREEKLEDELKEKRKRWIENAERAAQPVLERAKSILKRARVPARALKTQFWISVNREDIINDILEAARVKKCGTIVFGRRSFSWFNEVFQQHVADELVRNGQGFAIWVVE
ncbi:MAG: universal stress protein [Candidatus Binatia bacterium]